MILAKQAAALAASARVIAREADALALRVTALEEAEELAARARAVGLPWAPQDGAGRLFEIMPYFAMPQRRFAALRRYLGVGR